MKESRVTTILGIQYPIIQAAMTWLTNAEFVAAVSNAGGLGVLGPNAGQSKEADSVEAAVKAMRQEIAKIRSLTTRNFAVNYLMPHPDYEASTQFSHAFFELYCEERVPAVVVVGYEGADITSTIAAFKALGIKVIYRDISPTVSGSIRVEAAGADALIITGHEAGGHLSHYRISTLTLLPQVAAHVQIPIIAAGGIYNASTAQAAFVLGAEAVYMGTRFINTWENPAHSLCKEAIIRSTSEGLAELTTEAGTFRVIPTDVMTSFDQKAPYAEYLHAFRRGMLEGKTDHGAFICISESAGGINSIVSCEELITEIISGVAGYGRVSPSFSQ